MRTKCSGGSPCEKCSKDGAACVFGDRKRERNKKDLAESLLQIEELKTKNSMLLDALKTIAASPNLDSTETGNIREMILNCELEVQGTPSMTPSTRTGDSSRFPPSVESTPEDEQYTDASLGSPVGQDVLTHSIDVGRGRGAVGFIGKISEVSWIARAYSYLITPATEDFAMPEKISNHIPATQFNYFMDDEDLLSLDEDYVDALHWPGDLTARILCEAFFHALHGSFNCLARGRVLEELNKFPHNRMQLSWDQRRWLAVANLMWAIGSKWLHHAMLDDEPGMESHLVYYARARALGLDHRVMLDNPGLHGINALGLLSFYLFTNGSVSRAWALIGLAIRNATCLGLHLRAVDSALSQVQLEERARLWFSLYSLEVAMSEVLGKPPLTSLEYTTVPVELLKSASVKDSPSDTETDDTRRLWLDFLRRRRDTSQTMRGGQVPWQNFQFIGYGPPLQHISSRARLSIISNRVMTQLYMPKLSHSWSSMQKIITGLSIQLVGWENSLPEELNLKSTIAMGTDPRAKIDLALYHQSIRMILYRPCLCHIRIPNESDYSRDFNLSGARSCVRAGVTLVDILPEDASAHEAYQLLPWWNLLHYLGQALGVFILELCLDMEHFDGVAAHLTPQVRKAMSYLWCLTAGSLSAYKAWRIFRHMLWILSLRVDSFDVVDILLEAHIPTGWTVNDEALLMNTLRPIGDEPMMSM
ncbi:hypothetical protein G647_06219 [Cladophialophora carrionii CBS 160.54]|uniref:Xylanolytic transcriptional activator regulatory domain-containing protein n=1 Tax=Cladophialophora carrionii CBS 160.54 TaxID=1279043 RepID=V9D652_9EURO|nr:uncharacterized protein G647_06219 [Cladophialophora carrionii CBS 160.54]ETI22146.1 hypothetical protein G647_06219 [Cladophialophora carrionii CBS 160.54]